MRLIPLIVGLLGPSSAVACDVVVLQVSLGVVFVAQQPVLPSMDTSLNCAIGQGNTLPLFGTYGRVTLQRDLRLLGQVGLSAGALLPHTIGTHLELGLLGDNGFVRTTFGASVWAAPLADRAGTLSPRLAAGWTRFQRDGLAQDWLTVSGGIAAAGSLRPTSVGLTSDKL